MKKLSVTDIILLGMTNFALYVGAGNIIFPPFLGMNAGDNVFWAVFGFLMTGVGLPVIAAVALAMVKGNLGVITRPIGLKCGLAVTVLCYLCIGPMYAIPRTTTVSYELALRAFDVEGEGYLPAYSIGYFVFAAVVALYPNKILDTVGRILSPVKIISLAILCLTALVLIPGSSSPAAPGFDTTAGSFSQGIINGYLTLDTLASLAFGIVIVNAIRSRGVEDGRSIIQYAMLSGCIAGLGMAFIYCCLFVLGHNSYILDPQAENGAQILSAYVNFAYGTFGNLFLAFLIMIACMVTAIGLICACSSYFASITKIPYKVYAIVIAVFSFLISNLGLSELIRISVPVMVAIYPMFIVLVFCSFIRRFMHNETLVTAPMAVLALLFGVNDALESLGLSPLPQAVKDFLPLYSSCLGWLIPCLIFAALLLIFDRLRGHKTILAGA